MYEIIRGYKKGRAVMFYDVLDQVENKKSEMISKDDIVKLCNDGKVVNAKIQMWQGAAIVRVSTKDLPLVKLDDNNNIVGVAYQAVRSGNRAIETNGRQCACKDEPVVDISSKSKVVGKLSNKRAKVNTSFAGYDYKNRVEQQELQSTVVYTGLDTLGDLFDKMASDFNIKNIDLYKAECGKRVNLSRKVSGIMQSELGAIQSSIATYLMNMAHNEINEVYMKYSKLY